jgi:hypothetical protein
MDHWTLIDRLVAAYSFAAREPGETVTLADVRMFLTGVTHEDLNPTLRALFGTEVSYQPYGYPEGSRGIVRLHAATTETTFEQYDGGVEIGGMDYTSMAIEPC